MNVNELGYDFSSALTMTFINSGCDEHVPLKVKGSNFDCRLQVQGSDQKAIGYGFFFMAQMRGAADISHT